ncbi:MAG TPA: nucleotidyltransferase family protein [Candidatus Sulfotelmatobacter sp.]|nr:nucleotidyltransferase family protein [Candidatus Sulfotelmatobacter sp.]
MRDQQTDFQLLSALLLSSQQSLEASNRGAARPTHVRVSSRIHDTVTSLTLPEIEEITELASTNHVIVRAFELMQPIFEAEGKSEAAETVSAALRKESSRIHVALNFLREICAALEKAGCSVTVIKSLDHWPDLGSDLDLYTSAKAGDVVQAMTSTFGAKLAERSWGDRLANKWNFIVPGLPELIEIHVGRLGQTGEQTVFSEALLPRTRMITIAGQSFRVLAPEDRIVISTLQRMYRHFYIRLCDVVDNARLLDAREVDFDYLHNMGCAAGLWEGIATYLVVISQYVESFRGYGVPLPSLVTKSAKFGANPVRFRKEFLRVPILPHSINLYAGELKTLLFKGQLRNTLRLSLLPGLATAAALEMKITGSDKGIW